MYYLFLVYSDDPPPFSDRVAYEEACRANDAALRERGYLLAGASLQSGSPSLILRVEGEELSLADGFPTGAGDGFETVYVINARDLNEAIRLAAGMPQARRGRIEITSLSELQV